MKRRQLTAVVACALAAATGCTDSGADAGAGTAAPSPSAPAVAGAAQNLPEVVRRVEPSVVTIFTEGGSGSGVVYRKDGIIVTNAHVVGDSKAVQVAFADGQQVSGTVTATDVVTDLAVVDAAREDLPVASFEEKLPVPGEIALAMGAPLGFENSVTAGIISGLSREIPGSATRTRSLVDLIQTDAAISPGNSGGALVNAQGRVIGINEAYIPPSAGAVSIGFAIPAATVTDVVDELLEDGKASHPFLGVAPARVTPQLAEGLGLGTATGVLVRGVVAGGPAAKAGVQPGDVITRLDDQRIQSVEDFLGALRAVEPGQAVSLTIVRSGDEKTVNLTAGEMPS